MKSPRRVRPGLCIHKCPKDPLRQNLLFNISFPVQAVLGGKVVWMGESESREEQAKLKELEGR